MPRPALGPAAPSLSRAPSTTGSPASRRRPAHPRAPPDRAPRPRHRQARASSKGKTCRDQGSAASAPAPQAAVRTLLRRIAPMPHLQAIVSTGRAEPPLGLTMQQPPSPSPAAASGRTSCAAAGRDPARRFRVIWPRAAASRRPVRWPPRPTAARVTSHPAMRCSKCFRVVRRRRRAQGWRIRTTDSDSRSRPSWLGRGGALSTTGTVTHAAGTVTDPDSLSQAQAGRAVTPGGLSQHAGRRGGPKAASSPEPGPVRHGRPRALRRGGRLSAGPLDSSVAGTDTRSRTLSRTAEEHQKLQT